ncbi:hypothetical protein, partial [Chromobacterium haemolyticum]|uniref:hypothetical protein n=1 Tax=Chromobacterium haemolyticum TaxID=394935 RepID=UPI0009F05319
MTFKQKIVTTIVVVLLGLLMLVSLVIYDQRQVQSDLHYTQDILMADVAKITTMSDAANGAALSLREGMLLMAEEQFVSQEFVNVGQQKFVNDAALVGAFGKVETLLKQLEADLSKLRVHRHKMSEQEINRLTVLRENILREGRATIAGVYQLNKLAANGKGDFKAVYIGWQNASLAVLVSELKEMEKLYEKAANRNLAELEENLDHTIFKFIILGLLVFALVSGVLLWQLRFVSRTIGGQMERLFRHMDHIAKDDFSQPIRYRPGMEQSLIALLAKLQERLKAAKAMVLENARIRVALDSSSANVMLVDERRQISFVNRALQARLPQLANR